MSEPATAPAIGETLALTPSRGRWLPVAIIAAIFVAIGLYLIAIRGSWTGWLSAGFFGFVLAVSLAQLAGLGSRLTLRADTFELANFGRTNTERWDEVRDFTAFRQSFNTLVGFDRVRDEGTRMGSLNRAMGGRTAALPDTFGLEPDALVALLEAYRKNGVARSWADHRNTVATTAGKLRASPDRDATAQRVLIDPDEIRRALPDDASPWPSLLVIDEAAKRTDGGPKILTAIDVLNPETRWLARDVKERSAFDNMGAEEFWIVDPAEGSQTRITQADRSAPSEMSEAGA
jgi:hypothetical protein